MIASSILNSITFKNVPSSNTYPNMWNTLHANRVQGNNKIIPYYQKFPKDHVVYLQFESNAASNVTLKCYQGTTELSSSTLSYASNYGTGDVRYYTNFIITFNSTYYDKKVYFTATQGEDTLTSESVYIYDLAPEIEKGTVKYIKYTNLDRIESDLDDRFIDWSAIVNTGNYMDFFVDAIDIDPNDTDESEVLEGSQSKTILSASFYSGRVLSTGPIPDYMAARLGMASSLDIFMVNGIQYIKSGEIGQERFGGSTLYQASLKLTQKNAIGINVDNLGITVTETEPPVSGTPMYIGTVTSAAPDETEVKLISPIDAIKENQIKEYTMSDARFCFAYPTTFGNLTSILDHTGYEIISGFNITTLNFTINGNIVNFTIYTLKSLATVTSFNVTYKFGRIPLPPVAIAATNIEGTEFLANWNASEGATQYHIDLSTESDFSTYILEDQHVGAGLSFGFTGLTPGETYYYRVRAINVYGTSGNSNTITVILTAPAAPVATAATSVGDINFNANWETSARATGYYLDVSLYDNFSSFVAGYENYDAGNFLGATITELDPATTYYYRVRAYNLIGTSGNSNTITVETLA